MLYAKKNPTPFLREMMNLHIICMLKAILDYDSIVRFSRCIYAAVTVRFFYIFVYVYREKIIQE